MNNLSKQNIISSLSCQKLIITRRRISLSLTFVMLFSYSSFMIMIAIFPEWVGSSLSEGTTITWGVVAGISIIFIAFILTGCYTWFANLKLEPLKRALVEELMK